MGELGLVGWSFGRTHNHLSHTYNPPSPPPPPTTTTHYHQRRRQAQAFLRGFRDLIPSTWLRMFGAEELAILLTGDKRAIDMEDLRAHTRYSGGYHPSQPIIGWLWDALRSFTPEQQAAFLMFVTSCSRQPLLGFQHLNPPLCVQRVPLQDDSGGDGERLPSAATCMNLLKLPAYTSPETLREKLLYAITAGAGFELS